MSDTRPEPGPVAAVEVAGTAAPPTRWSARYASLVVRLRFGIVAVWIGLAAAAYLFLPASAHGGSGLDGFVPPGTPSIQTEIASVRAFGFPLIARTVIVQRDPDGLSPYAQAEAVLRAVALDQQEYDNVRPILGALPLTNSFGLFPASGERNTTALTYLFMPPTAGFGSQTSAAERFAARYLTDPDDAYVGVTGSVPARVEQEHIVNRSLPTVEIATLAAIVLIVGITFRSVVAPLIALGTAGIAFIVTIRLAAAAGSLLGVAIPAELTPLVLALLLGVATDYVIFFLSGAQHAFREGETRLAAACTATSEFGPIVAVAGITVAAGTASLLAAKSSFFRAFGPALAVTVLVALAVSLTLIPAAMAILGRGAFWPTHPRPDWVPGRSLPHVQPPQLRRRAIVAMARRPVALVVFLACTGVLVVAALPARNLHLGLSFVPSLPASNEARVAAQAAKEGFAPGILSPTVLLLQDAEITSRRADLARLGDLIEGQPGVAGVLGPGDVVPKLEAGVLLAKSNDAARYLIVLDDDPLGAAAIATFDRLHQRLPGLLAQANLSGVKAGFGGDTALAGALVDSTRADLGRIATAALVVNLLLLVLFLRALVAPLCLLATSVLSLAAALGVTTFLFQDVLGHDGLTFYVPFAAAVLLVALGSDYNIFGVGHIWRLTQDRTLSEALVEAVPRTTRAITAAGVTLAASFGLLSVVPLRPFRELAFVMMVGILLDAVVVRSLLVPTLLALLGRLSWWPSAPPETVPRSRRPLGRRAGERAHN